MNEIVFFFFSCLRFHIILTDFGTFHLACQTLLRLLYTAQSRPYYQSRYFQVIVDQNNLSEAEKYI